jgi:hypothetical protein
MSEQIPQELADAINQEIIDAYEAPLGRKLLPLSETQIQAAHDIAKDMSLNDSDYEELRKVLGL